MKNYIINKNTCAIVKKNKNTLIIEDEKVFLVNSSILTIINNSCKYYGSDYRGSLNSVNCILRSKYKNPILINENYNLILFPTESIRNNNAMFINYKKIINYDLYYDIIRIFFTNKIMLTTKISKYIFSEQLLKCVIFNNILNLRKKT